VSSRKKPKKVGRPALPKGHAKARIVPVRFNTELFRAITAAAKTKKQSVSEWIRKATEAAVG
jgi:predicted HicB family RNase H-like nuclease